MNVHAHCYGNTLAVQVAAPALAGGEGPRRDLHIGFLIDNSGSMEGPRLDSVKRTLRAVRTHLQAGDRVTLVTFSEVARVLLSRHSLAGEGMDALYAAVDNIRADASTNLGAGIEALYGVGTDYDAVILLTDGIVNVGITSTAGLRAMALGAGAGRMTFNTLGYGADHNRSLLRDLATRTLGSYTFVSSDEILPIAMADIVSGARAEALRDVRITVPAGWTSLEAGGTRLGNLVGGRDYWCVFTTEAPATEGGSEVSVATGTAGVDPIACPIDRRPDDQMPAEVREQVFRARVAAAMIALSDSLEGGGAQDTARTRLEALRDEMAALPEETRVRPLMLRLIGQVADILSQIAAVPPMPAYLPSLRPGAARIPAGMPLPARAGSNLMARLASGATTLCTQRGVDSSAIGVTESGSDPLELVNQVSFFSTPSQRATASVVHATYSSRPADPDADAPSEPIMPEID